MWISKQVDQKDTIMNIEDHQMHEQAAFWFKLKILQENKGLRPRKIDKLQLLKLELHMI